MINKIPPQNIDAEQSVLGAVLLDKEAIYKVMEILKPEDFYRDSHRLIYEAMLDLIENDKPLDLITLCEELRQDGKLDQVGGVSYVATLAGLVPTAANVEYYAKIVEEKSLLRTLIQVSNKVSAMGYEGSDDAHGLLDQLERSIYELNNRRQSASFNPISEILLETFDQIEQMQKNKGKLTGIPTGFIDLDALTCGFQKSDLIILAARPSMGKTTLALMLAINAAVKGKVPVAIFSLEMSKEQLVQRMLCAEAMVDQHKLKTGHLQEDDWLRLTEVAGYLSKAPIYIDDTPAISIRELRAKARRLQGEKDLGFLVIDYMQLMQGSRRSESRQQEIAEISRSLKALAKELNIPVLALSQLSRAVEQRQDKRPIMSDLRESGSIEQDADLVMFIYREDYYDPETENKGVAEIIVSKHRNGPVGSVQLGFLHEFTKFVNLSKEDYR
ncbi:replicative DNA helicase [Desulfofalx alkaliphila]|uniref:replicative DNA helicase n=1 Tax=Desulfofalx alkaliphila TaxID=105483 RepID=UPI0004E0CB1D|nr:replicative DNA helicase [Desulfofalx alkaliphila]